MANRCANLQRAGLPESSKVATATQEILRRLKNVSRELPESEIESVQKSYMSELKVGGYSHKWRTDVLRSACLGFSKIWSMECRNEGHVNRPGHITRMKRRAMKLEGNSHWFKVAPKTTLRSKPGQK